MTLQNGHCSDRAHSMRSPSAQVIPTPYAGATDESDAIAVRLSADAPSQFVGHANSSRVALSAAGFGTNSNVSVAAVDDVEAAAAKGSAAADAGDASADAAGERGAWHRHLDYMLSAIGCMCDSYSYSYECVHS